MLDLSIALAWYDRNFGQFEGTGQPEVRVMAEAARKWQKVEGILHYADSPEEMVAEIANLI